MPISEKSGAMSPVFSDILDSNRTIKKILLNQIKSLPIKDNN